MGTEESVYAVVLAAVVVLGIVLVGSRQAAYSATFADTGIAVYLDEASRADSAAARYALDKASSRDVRDFARVMMNNHHELRLRVQRFAHRRDISLARMPAPDPVKPLAESEMNALHLAEAGAAFDRVYIAQEIVMDRALIDLVQKLHAAADSRRLRALMADATPVLVKHLSRALAIQAELAAAGS